ncbi:MAG TPA: hypothetical protein DEH78_30405 [Solibacterales bacterium]|nr:hypothetical protein [Bryobacterales bacterium]
MKRLVTGLILGVVFSYIILWGPPWAFAAALVAAALLSYYEYANIAAAYGLERFHLAPYAMGLVVLAAPRDAALLVLLALAPLVLALRAGDLSKALPSAAAAVLGVVYIFGSWRTALELRQIGPWWLFFALTLNWVGDTAAYYGGRAFGRHKLAPRISPGKTWEGAAFSLAGSLAFGLVYAHWLLPSTTWPVAAALTVAGNLAGQMGDLVESAMKRGAGVKDSGTILPGHGGWLDRVDASLFCMPVMYCLLAYVFAGTR